MTLTSQPEPPAPPPEPEARAGLTESEAEELGTRIQQQAAVIAQATCELLLMVGEFDACEGSRWYHGLKSTAHWLAWSCSMAPGTAREHVRVARALPAMPLTVAEFRAGRLSYSKVREMTRVAGRTDEALLVELARAMTASQLADTIGRFGSLDGIRLGQDAVRHARWQVRDDGMVEIRALLPAEVGAEVLTALNLALERDGTEPPSADPAAAAAADGLGPRGDFPRMVTHVDQLSEQETAVLAAETTTTPTLEQRRADALLDLARTFLDAEPDDRSGEDRHLVVVQVSAEALVRDVPAGTPPEDGIATQSPHSVPAGALETCGVLGAGPLEPRTAERLACTGKVALTITDRGGEILHLGRSQRLASRAQRRALRLRDTTCTFPGCHQSRHLDAHHVVPWSEGGPTDIEGLALLCRRHHVMVHEGGLRLVASSTSRAAVGQRFEVIDAEGRPVQARWPATLERLAFHRRIIAAAEPDADPTRIAATTGGAGFRLANCVDALCQSAVEVDLAA